MTNNTTSIPPHLARLDVDHAYSASDTPPLQGRSYLVIGAGPAGLVFARNAATAGAQVTVLERAQDPRVSREGYADRSFNITLNEVGRYVLGSPAAWNGGIWLEGRALHHSQDAAGVTYGSYGDSQVAHLTSIPRPLLRQNMVGLAEAAGAGIRFGVTVTGVNSDTGEVACINDMGAASTLAADLIIISDGLHSLSDGLDSSEHQSSLKIEPRGYVSALLRREDAPELSLNHIHFWHEGATDAYAIGIPNLDGSMALLLTSQFDDIAADAHPFATPEAATARLRDEYPQLHALSPQLADQLPTRRRGRFYFKSITNYIPGPRAVIVGDAGCVFPPWSGFGANNAMYGAASLVYQLIEHADNMSVALSVYQSQQRQLSRLIMEFVEYQGKFLSNEVVENPNARSDSMELAPLIARSITLAQQVSGIQAQAERAYVPSQRLSVEAS